MAGAINRSRLYVCMMRLAGRDMYVLFQFGKNYFGLNYGMIMVQTIKRNA